jgi:hypothetical protein
LKYPDDALGAFRPIQTDRDNFTSTATRFASAKLERRFSSSPKNDLRAAKRGLEDCASARFSTISRRAVDRPRIVTQEKGFSEEYLRVPRFPWGRRLDDPNQLVPNFNRSVSRSSQNVCGIMERFAFDEQIDARMADKELRCEVIKAFARIDRER